jgi:zinc protease
MRDLPRAAARAVWSLLATLPAMARANPPPLSHHTCPDGLEVVVAENHSSPLVTVEIAVHEGAMTEDADYNGLSHLYEHMFFKGNAAMPDQMAWLARARALGMEFNGTTDNERVNYWFNTSSDHLTDAMVFMRDAIATPLFDKQELQRERVVVTGEIDRNESEPGYHLWHEVEQRVYWKYPTRKHALGTRSTVLSATVDKMRTIQKRYYVPNNALLVVTGDVRPGAVFQQADQIYIGWARAADPFATFPLPKHPPLRGTEVVLLEQPVENLQAMAMWQGPSTVGDELPDTYAADLLTQLVNDPGSRFQRTLVDSGTCVRADVGYSTQRNTGQVTIEFEALPDKVDACVGALFAELPKLRAPDYFSDEELHNAAHRIEVYEAQGRERTTQWAHLISFVWTSASLDYYANYVDRVKAVKQSDLARYLERWIVGKPYVLGAMASKKLIEGGLTKGRLEKAIAKRGTR